MEDTASEQLGEIRREARNEPILVKYRGVTFETPSCLIFPQVEELMLVVNDHLQEDQAAHVLDAYIDLGAELLGDQWERFNKFRPSLDDLQALILETLRMMGSPMEDMLGFLVGAVKYFDGLEASFQEAYHLDLGRCLYGPNYLTCRRLVSLSKGLGPGSALHRAIDPGWYWNMDTEIMAVLTEEVSALNRMFMKVNSDRQAHIPPVTQVPRPERPEELKPRRKMASVQEMKSFFRGGQ